MNSHEPPLLPDHLVPLTILGRGSFASVWCCEDKKYVPDNDDKKSSPRLVALKISDGSRTSNESIEIESETYEYIQHLKGSSKVPVSHCLGWLSIKEKGKTKYCLILKKYGIDVFHLMQSHIHFPRDSVYYKFFACRRRKEVNNTKYKRSRNAILCGYPIPLNIVKKIIRTLLTALEFLHDNCGLVHTDIKPDNLFLKENALPDFVKNKKDKKVTGGELPKDKITAHQKTSEAIDDSFKRLNESGKEDNNSDTTISLSKEEDKRSFDESSLILNDNAQFFDNDEGIKDTEWSCVLSDFGNTIRRYTENREESRNYDDIPDEIEFIYDRNMYQSRHYRAPECLMGIPKKDALKTNSVYSDASKMDIWSVGCLVYEMITGKYLFDPIKDASSPGIPSGVGGCGKPSRKRDHIRQIIEITSCSNWTCFSDSPRYSMMFNEINGKTKFKTSGLIEIRSLDMCMQDDGIRDPDLRRQLCDFIMPMLIVNPADRASAYDMLRHPFLITADSGEK